MFCKKHRRKQKQKMVNIQKILNILKGDMSIVGPRPERIEHVQAYSEEIPEFGFRLKVKGGLTGYAQIYGKYNTSAYDKLRLDLTYMDKIHSTDVDDQEDFTIVEVMVNHLPEFENYFEK